MYESGHFFLLVYISSLLLPNIHGDHVSVEVSTFNCVLSANISTMNHYLMFGCCHGNNSVVMSFFRD